MTDCGHPSLEPRRYHQFLLCERCWRWRTQIDHTHTQGMLGEAG